MKILGALVLHTGTILFLTQALKASLIPVPTPSLIIAAVVLLKPPHSGLISVFDFWTRRIVLPSAFGMTMGSLPPFWLLRWKTNVVEEWSKNFPKPLRNYWKKLEIGVKLYPRLSTIIFRAAPFIPLSVASAAAGALGVPSGEFVLWTFIGALIRCFILAFAGFLTRDTVAVLILHIHRFNALTSVAVMVTLAAGVWIAAAKSSRSRHRGA
ncbi:MAG: DedA family protein [Elusimicrobiota bacterium]